MNLRFFIDLLFNRLCPATPRRVDRDTLEATAALGSAGVVLDKLPAHLSAVFDSECTAPDDWTSAVPATVGSSDGYRHDAPFGDLHQETYINPATGWMMVGGLGGLDVGGNSYGTSASDVDISATGCIGGSYDYLASVDCFSSPDCFSNSDIFDSGGSGFGCFGSEW